MLHGLINEQKTLYRNVKKGKFPTCSAHVFGGIFGGVVWRVGWDGMGFGVLRPMFHIKKNSVTEKLKDKH